MSETQRGEELTASQIQNANMSWLSPMHALPVHDNVLRAAVRNRLACPLFAAGQRCQYVPKTSGLQCCTPLDTRGQHASRCCNALAIARHHGILDILHDLACKAGHHSTLEQLIVTRPGAARASPADEPAIEDHGYSKQCDILVTKLDGLQTAIDVACVQSMDDEPAAPVIDRIAARKLYQYGSSPERRRTFAGIDSIPFVVDPICGFGSSALGFMLQLSRDIARRQHGDVMDTFYRNCATMQKAVIEGQWRLTRAAGRPCWCA